jgi:sugar/nucleoside kinase (ribokinase family)
MRRRFDVLVVGELNVDLILDGMGALPEVGKEILARSMTLTLGSSSAIFASNLRCLGPEVAFLGKVGDDLFGSFVVDRLRARGVDTSRILTVPGLSTGATVALNHGEDRAMITAMGAMEHLAVEDVTPDHLASARHLHLSSVFLQPLLLPHVATLFRRAKEAGMTTSLNPQWDPAEAWDLDLPAILPSVDLFLPNEAEILHLTRMPDVSSALYVLRPFARTVVVKQGSRGATAQAGSRVIAKPAFFNPCVVDAIGAGDSFDAGFVARFLEGDTLEGCLLSGNLMGAVSTTAAGGTGAFTDLAGVMAIARERFHHVRRAPLPA